MPKFHYLYTYDLKKVPSSKKVRFVYLLKGRRGEKGIIHSLKGKFLVPGCFIVPQKSDKEITEIFNLWKIKFKKKKIQLTD